MRATPILKIWLDRTICHLPNSFSFNKSLSSPGNVPSLILWGPRAWEETTIANIISKRKLKRTFLTHFLPNLSSWVKRHRETVIEKAKFQMGGCAFFIDEIHRFNVSLSKDALLGSCGKWELFANWRPLQKSFLSRSMAALLSRCQVFYAESSAWQVWT